MGCRERGHHERNPSQPPGLASLKGEQGSPQKNSVQERARARVEREGRCFPASRLLLQAGLERRWGPGGRSRDKLAPRPTRPLPRDCNPKVGSFKLGSERRRIFAKLGVGWRLFPASRVHLRRACPPGEAGRAPEPSRTNGNFPAPAGARPGRSPLLLGVGNLFLLTLPPQLLKHLLPCRKVPMKSGHLGSGYPERCHLPLLPTGAHRQARDDPFSGPQFPQLGNTKGWPRRLWGFWPLSPACFHRRPEPAL